MLSHHTFPSKTLIGGAVLLVRYILQPLFARFDRIGEYVFLLAIGWCLGIAELFE